MVIGRGYLWLSTCVTCTKGRDRPKTRKLISRHLRKRVYKKPVEERHAPFTTGPCRRRCAWSLLRRGCGVGCCRRLLLSRWCLYWRRRQAGRFNRRREKQNYCKDETGNHEYADRSIKTFFHTAPPPRPQSSIPICIGPFFWVRVKSPPQGIIIQMPNGAVHHAGTGNHPQRVQE